MKTRTGISISLCGSLLFGCTILPSMSSLFDSTPQSNLRLAKSADSEYERGKQLHRTGQYLEAKQAYINSLSIDPKHVEAKNGIAVLMGISGDLDTAIVLLEQLSKDHPAPHVYSNLAYALQLRGREWEARDALQQALSIDPSNESNRSRLQALDQKLNAASESELFVKTDSSAFAVSSENLIEPTGPSTYALRYTVSVPPSSPRVKLLESESELSAALSSDAQLNVSAKIIHGAALSVEIVNGNGVNGLAKQLGASLPVDYWHVIRTANYRHYGVGVTRIEYLPDHADGARRFSSMLGIGQRIRPNTEQRGALRIILGHDCKNIAPLKQRLAAILPAPSS